MWCKRNPKVAGLAAALAAAVVVGAGGILFKWMEVRKANLQIRAEWEASRQLNEFLVTDLLAQSSPFGGARPDVAVSVLLDRSASLAGARFANRPRLEAPIRLILGNSYLALGMTEKAETELLHASRLHQSFPGTHQIERLSTEYLLARLRFAQRASTRPKNTR